MGGTLYSSQDRNLRAANSGYFSKSANDIFTQSKESKVHESMLPNGVKFRECFDSEVHPKSLAIIIGLDVTGSMGRIPHHMVKDGLPHMMQTLIDNGVPDAAVCFMAIGDHKSDRGPLQVGQFESGDKELDTHLTNTWLEGSGGGNGGESYFLPWYFAAKHTKIDCFTKRNIKGFLFTIGDEHCHSEIPASYITGITGDPCEGTLKANDILKEAQKTYNVYHLCLTDGDILRGWKKMLGENCVEVRDELKIPGIIAKIVADHASVEAKTVPAAEEKKEGEKAPMML